MSGSESHWAPRSVNRGGPKWPPNLSWKERDELTKGGHFFDCVWPDLFWF